MGHNITMEGSLSVNHPDVPQTMGWDPCGFFPSILPSTLWTKVRKPKKTSTQTFPLPPSCGVIAWFSLMLSSSLCLCNSKGDSLGVEGLQPSAESHTLEGRDYDIAWQLPRSLHFRDFTE